MSESKSVLDIGTQLAEKAMSYLQSTEDFLTSEIPLYLQELLLWYGVQSFIIFVSLVLASILSLWFALKLYKYAQEECTYANSGPPEACAIVLAIVFITCSITTFNTLDWLQIWIAPRVWLLEYVGGLVK